MSKQDQLEKPGFHMPAIDAGVRIGHVHLKNVRPEIVLAARAERHSFATAVRSGVFTVPGDGGFDFTPVLQVLQQQGYEGWLVVEAEQDPRKAHPLTYARMGYENLSAMARDAGFQVESRDEAAR